MSFNNLAFLPGLALFRHGLAFFKRCLATRAGLTTRFWGLCAWKSKHSFTGFSCF